jgi:hypothetical protein
MDLHVLHDEVALEVNDERPGHPRDLSDLLCDLSFVRASAPAVLERLVLSIHPSARPSTAPSGGRVELHADALHVTESGDDVYVSDGASLFHIQAQRGCATAQIARSFDERPLHLRQRFWAHGVLRLLRQQGLYGLHAAGVATPRGDNLLIVGPSGCGKSTMTIGLIRCGGRFLSDDAILLLSAPDGIDALTLRKPFSVDAARASDYPDFVSCSAQSPGSDRRKCRADALHNYPSQHVRRFRPGAIVFPRIVPQPTSTLEELPRSVALQHLLSQSGPELFDKPTMAAHLELLGRLLRQTTSYELRAGQDLHHAPQGIIDLLEHTKGRSACPGSSSN